MAKLIALDDGHGIGTPGKRTPYIKELGRQIMENEFNREVVKYLDMELKRCGFRTLLTAPTDEDTPLQTRTDLANRKNADLFISVHFNALDGKFDGPGKDPEGFSAHIYPGHLNKEAGKFAEIALKHLEKGTPQKNRGVVQQDLHVTRVTKMVAVLFELGFMDNEREAKLMLNVAFQKECARELAMAACEYYNVKYVPEITQERKPVEKKQYYRVRKTWADAGSQKGAFLVLENAKKVADANKGYEVYNEQGNVIYPLPKKEEQKAETYTLITSVKGYYYAADAKAHRDDRTLVARGTYHVYSRSDDMINVTTKPGVPGSWINPADNKVSAKKEKEKINGIPVLGRIRIVNVANAAYICDRPSSSKSKNLDVAKKGSEWPIAGSVPGWYEIIYKGRRAYVNAKYGQRI